MLLQLGPTKFGETFNIEVTAPEIMELFGQIRFLNLALEKTE